MVICPIAIAVHCTGCPFFKFCPAKTILGDYVKDDKFNQKVAENEQQKHEEKSSDSR